MSKLTKKTVEMGEAPERREGESEAEYRKRWRWLGDAEVGGFGVKIYGSGRRVYALRYRTESGRTRMLTLGAHGELTVQGARDRARVEKVKVLDGTDPQAERQRRAVTLGTVRDLMQTWLMEYAKTHRRRWKDDQYRMNARILPELGRIALEDLTPDALAGWHRRAGKEAPVEANRGLETLRAAWRWAAGEGILPEGLHDPTRRVKRFREKSRDRWLREEEIARLMNATKGQEDPYVRAAVPLFLLTGLRKRELLGARWTDVDFDRAEIRLRETKSGGAQVRLLPSPAVSILRELPRMEGSPWVFPSPVDPKKARSDLKRPWDRIRQEAELEDITLHDLRRTAGSFMAQNGVPIQVIQEVLGQSHPGVTKIYARLASENERNALDTLSAALAGALGLGPEGEPTALPTQVHELLKASGGDTDRLFEGLRGLVGRVEAVEA